MPSKVYRWNIRQGSFQNSDQIKVEYHERERAFCCSCCGNIQHGGNYCTHVIAVLVRRMIVTELAALEVD